MNGLLTKPSNVDETKPTQIKSHCARLTRFDTAICLTHYDSGQPSTS